MSDIKENYMFTEVLDTTINFRFADCCGNCKYFGMFYSGEMEVGKCIKTEILLKSFCEVCDLFELVHV